MNFILAANNRGNFEHGGRFTSALSLFPNVNVLKPEQKECIKELLSKKDVFGLLPTGFGKSLIYQLFPRLHVFLNGGDKKRNVLVVSALKAITEEQVLELNEFGIPAASIGDNRKRDNEILQGKFEVVFGNAECGSATNSCSWGRKCTAPTLYCV